MWKNLAKTYNENLGFWESEFRSEKSQKKVRKFKKDIFEELDIDPKVLNDMPVDELEKVVDSLEMKEASIDDQQDSYFSDNLAA